MLMVQSEKQVGNIQKAPEMFPLFPLSLGVTYKKLLHLFTHYFKKCKVRQDRTRP